MTQSERQAEIRLSKAHSLELKSLSFKEETNPFKKSILKKRILDLKSRYYLHLISCVFDPFLLHRLYLLTHFRV